MDTRGRLGIARNMPRSIDTGVSLLRRSVDRSFQHASSVPLVTRILARDIDVAAAFHQIIDQRRPHEGAGFCNHLRSDFVETVAFLDSLQQPSTDVWVTFDDGYAKAAEALENVAPQFPSMRFVFFVCPEKTSKKVGFRWDAWERLHEKNGPVPEFDDFDSEPATAEENSRLDLLESAKDERFLLASEEQCRSLQRHPNVYLGNHTNRHFALSSLSDAEAVEEIRESHEQFRALFGDSEHFAFPYGTPGVSYNESHVAMVRSLGYRYVWSTEGSSFRRGSEASAVLPRIPMNGLATVAENRGTVAKYTVKGRLRRLLRLR